MLRFILSKSFRYSFSNAMHFFKILLKPRKFDNAEQLGKTKNRETGKNSEIFPQLRHVKPPFADVARETGFTIRALTSKCKWNLLIEFIGAASTPCAVSSQRFDGGGRKRVAPRVDLTYRRLSTLLATHE